MNGVQYRVCFQMKWLIYGGLSILIFPVTFGVAFGVSLEEYAKQPFGNVLFLRHAVAPGFDAKGKPDQFKIDDCSTQRNLDTKGREQAIEIGKRLKDEGIQFKRIHSSQWCRCLETAHLLKLGTVIPEPTLNSGFRRIFPKEKTLPALRELLGTFEEDEGLVLMVTHYGTISAITGIVVVSGGAVAYNTKTNVAKEVTF